MVYIFTVYVHSEVSETHQFLLQSSAGTNQRFCLSANSSSDTIKLVPCNTTDIKQHFFWFTNLTIASVNSKKCLTAIDNNLVQLKPCQRVLFTNNQHWLSYSDFLFNGESENSHRLKYYQKTLTFVPSEDNVSKKFEKLSFLLLPIYSLD